MTTEELQYQIIKTAWNLLSRIPLRIMYFISDLTFFPLYYIIKYRRKVVRKNLTESFPEKKEEDIILIEKKFYHYFIDYIFETCKLATISHEEMKQRMKYKNVKEVEDDLAGRKSISLFLGHYGNWEWISSIPLYLQSVPFSRAQVYKRIENKAVDKLFLENRSVFGVESIELSNILKWVNTRIRNNEVNMVGYIADQSPVWSSIHHWLNFLNHYTPVLTGTERITKRYGLEAYYIDVKRIKRGYYEAEFIKIHPDPKSLPDYELTDMYFNMLEKTIRKDPAFYLWSHNRFKRTIEEYEKNNPSTTN